MLFIDAVILYDLSWMYLFLSSLVSSRNPVSTPIFPSSSCHEIILPPPPSFPSLWKSAAPASHQHVGLGSAVRFRPVCVVVVLFFFLLIIYVSWWPSTLSHPFSFYFSVLMYSIFRIRVSISHTFIILSHHFCIHFPPPCVVLFINYNLLSVSVIHNSTPERAQMM